MKKIFLIIGLTLISILGNTQVPNKTNLIGVNSNDVALLLQHKTSNSSNPKGLKSGKIKLYINGSKSNLDTRFYTYPFNSNYDTFNASGLKDVCMSMNYGNMLDSLIGYTSWSTPNSSLKLYNTKTDIDSISIDSVYVPIFIENNSGITDTINYDIIEMDPLSRLPKQQATSLWHKSIRIGAIFTSSHQWTSYASDMGSKWACSYKYKVGDVYPALRLGFFGSILDTTGLLFTNSGANPVGGAFKSNVPTTYFIDPRSYKDWINATQFGYGTPAGSAGWFELQNLYAEAVVTLTLKNKSGFENTTDMSQAISLYPNPLSNGNTLIINLPENNFSNSVSNLLITDVLGRTIVVETNLVSNKLFVKSSNLVEGIYLYRLILNNNSYQGKFEVIK